MLEKLGQRYQAEEQMENKYLLAFGGLLGRKEMQDVLKITQVSFRKSS